MSKLGVVARSLALCAVAATHGCGVECNLACFDAVRIHVQDLSGSPIRVFSATLHIDDEPVSVDCGMQAGSAGASIQVDGDVLEVGCGMWGDSLHVLYAARRGLRYSATITTQSGQSFSGPIGLHTIASNDGCGTCFASESRVVVR